MHELFDSLPFRVLKPQRAWQIISQLESLKRCW